MEFTMMQYVGRYNVEANVARLLGQVGYIEDKSGLGNSPRLILSGMPVRVRLVRNDSGVTLAKSQVIQYKAGTWGTEAGAICGATGIGNGVVDPFLNSAVPVGATFLSFEEGPMLVLSSAAIANGAAIMTAADGKVVTRSALTDPYGGGVDDLAATVGRMLEEATDTGQYKRAYVKFPIL